MWHNNILKIMTKEQIEKLKAGDRITIEYEVVSTEPDYVDVRYKDGTFHGSFAKHDHALRNAEAVIPATKFEIGDLVRIIPDPLLGFVYGTYVDDIRKYSGKQALVSSLVNEYGNVELKLKSEGDYIDINAHCLELIEKAKVDKYVVKENTFRWLVTTNNLNIEVAIFDKATHPNPKEAAEAECKRLNSNIN